MLQNVSVFLLCLSPLESKVGITEVSKMADMNHQELEATKLTLFTWRNLESYE